MPELPEVETVCLALSRILNNSRVSNIKIFRKDLRWKIKENFETDLKEKILKKPYRRGKYILIPTSKEHILLIHLGMSGTIKIISNEYLPSKHDHVKINIQTIDNKFFSIIYNDPRRFGYIDFFHTSKIENHFLLKKLGVEPLGKNFTTYYLQKKIYKKSKCVKNFLMDQSIIAGIGNIYASEILHRANINPLRTVDKLNKEHLKSIIDATKFILKKSINVGGTSIRNHLQPDGKLGYFAQKLQVYGKNNHNCNKCNKMITMINISNRSTYFCGNCQT
jgi:formamidopyrimidine-DNA glycosylase